MKTHTYLLLACFLPFVSLLAAGNDPLDKKNAPPPAQSALVADELPGNILIVQETYHAPMPLVDQLMSQGLSATELRERLLKAAHDQAGEVSLFDLQTITTKSGQRCRSASTDNMSLVSKPIGVEWQAEPVLNKDAIGIDLSVSHERSQFRGFVLEPGVEPQFLDRDVTLNLPTASGKVSLFAVNAIQTGATDAASRSEVCFLIPVVCPLAQGGTAITTPWQLAARVYLVDRLLARDLVAEHGADSDVLHQKLAELTTAGTVTLEMMQAGSAKSGQRGSIWSGESASIRPGTASKGAKTPNRREMGWKLEFEPVVSPDGRTVDLNVAFSKTDYLGPLTGHDQLPNGYDISVIATREFTISAAVRAGKQLFLGTLNEPSDTGVNARKASTRTALAFLEARVLP